MRKVIFIILLVQICGNINAQYNKIISAITPTTPESSRFAKYLGYPVSPATGLIDIKIPIYTLREGGLEIPLSLSYHSSGIKIQDLPGTTGYGWSILPGLRISRTIMGKPDENHSVVPEKFKKILNGEISMERNELFKYKIFSAYDVFSSYIKPSWNSDDLQNDIFSLHLVDADVSFILNSEDGQTYKPETISPTPISIKPLIDKTAKIVLYGFEVKDAKGNIYYFGESNGEKENLSVFDYTERSANGPIGWMIRKIILANGEEIDFDYIENEEYLDPEINKTHSFLDDGRSTVYTEYNSQGNLNDAENDFTEMIDGGGGYSESEGRASNSNSLQKSKILTRIKTQTQSIDLNYNNDNYINNLEKIGSSLSKYQLVSVSVSSLGNSILDSQFTYKGDFLTKLQFPLNNEIYLFEYNMQENQMSTNAIDWWGYYNGRDGNTTSIPNQTVFLINGMRGVNHRTEKRVISNGYRQPNEKHMIAKSLKKISYPTGGRMEIFYSANKGKDGVIVGGLRVDSTISYDPRIDKFLYERYIYDEAVHEDIKSMIHEKNPNMTGVNLFGVRLNAGGSVLDHGKIRSTSTVRSRTISTFNPFDSYSNVFSTIYYKNVEKSDGEHRTVYQFNTHEIDRLSNIYLQYNNPAYITHHPMFIVSKLYKTPRLTDQYFYKLEGKEQKLIKSIHNTYNSSFSKIKSQFLLIPHMILVGQSFQGNIIDWINTSFSVSFSDQEKLVYELLRDTEHEPLLTREFFLCFGDISLKKQTEIDYHEGVETTKTTEYIYDSSRSYNIKEKTEVNSDKKTYKTKYYYTNDDFIGRDVLSREQLQTIDEMEEAGYKTTIMQESLDVDNIHIRTDLFGYKKISPLLYVVESSFTKNRNNNNFIKEIDIDKHDMKGNILQYRGRNNIPVSFLWSYVNQYPIARLNNTTYNQADVIARKHFGMSAIELGLMQEPKEEIVRTLYKQTETESQIVTYTHIPNIGLSTYTDESGKSTYYNYNKAFKLDTVSLDNRVIVETYDYHLRSVYDDMSVSFAPFSLHYGINKIEVVVEGGSGDFDTEWAISRTVDNIPIRITDFNKNKNILEIELLDYGPYSIKCIVYDKETMQSVEIQSTANISKQKVSLSNIIHTQQTNEVEISGDLYMPVSGLECNVTIWVYIDPRDDQYTKFTLNLNGLYYYFDASEGPFSLDVNLHKGTNRFSINRYSDGQHSSARGRIVINKFKENDFCEFSSQGTGSLDI